MLRHHAKELLESPKLLLRGLGLHDPQPPGPSLRGQVSRHNLQNRDVLKASPFRVGVSLFMGVDVASTGPHFILTRGAGGSPWGIALGTAWFIYSISV
jgi:hypothetical protein